jgi:hypothetical protein
MLTNTVAVVQVSNTFFSQAESTFDRDLDGWNVAGDADPPVFHASGGSSGGYISAMDQATGIYWYWVAPPKFHGNQSGAYGGLLQFDLEQNETTGQQDQADVLLSGGGLTLVFKTVRNPGTNWTSYKVLLDETAGWTKDSLSGPRPSQEEMLRALASLSDIRIRGEYSTAQDTGGLDNVSLLASPSNRGAVLVLRQISGRQFQLEWPVTATGFRLQTAASLSAPNWVDVTSAPTPINGMNTFVLPATSGFYRLRMP